MFSQLRRGLVRASVVMLGLILGVALSLSWLTGRAFIEPDLPKAQLSPATGDLVGIVETLGPSALRNAGKIAVDFRATIDLWREFSAR